MHVVCEHAYMLQDSNDSVKLDAFIGKTVHAIAGMGVASNQHGETKRRRSGLLWLSSQQLEENAEEEPAKEAGSIPGVKRFTGYASEIEQEGVGAQYSNTYKALQPIVKNYEQYKKVAPESSRDTDRFLKYQEEHAEELTLYNEVYRPVNEALQPLYQELARLSGKTGTQLETDTTPERELLGDPVKRERINALRKDIVEYQRGALEELHERKDVLGEVWTKRIRQGVFPKAATTPFLGDIKKDKKPVDNKDKSSYNFDFNLISSANAAETGEQDMQADLPPGFVYESPPAISRSVQTSMQDDELQPGFFAKYLPNVRKEVVEGYKKFVIDRTLKFEGGYSNNPKDSGGATNHGVTLATLKQVNPKATIEDVKALTKDKAVAIYDKMYWTDAKVDKLPIKLQDLVFDGNINHGVPGMTKILQRALNDLGTKVEIDGKLGNKTINAINEYDPKVMREAIIARRKSLYEGHKDAETFGKGWLARLAQLETIPQEAEEA